MYVFHGGGGGGGVAVGVAVGSGVAVGVGLGDADGDGEGDELGAADVPTLGWTAASCDACGVTDESQPAHAAASSSARITRLRIIDGSLSRLATMNRTGRPGV
jgi:hypothetical protein